MLWSDFERFGRFFDPWRDFERVSNAMSRLSAPVAVEFPAVNVWLAADNAVVTTELPGIDPQSLDITVVDKTLTLRGSRNPENLNEGEAYHRRERWNGQFTKTVEMPFQVEATKVEARFTKGILSILLPRAEAEKPKKITISAS